MFTFLGEIVCKMCASRHRVQSTYLEQVRRENKDGRLPNALLPHQNLGSHFFKTRYF